MFTGLIEATGTVRALTPVAGGQRLTIETRPGGRARARRQRRHQRRVPHGGGARRRRLERRRLAGDAAGHGARRAGRGRVREPRAAAGGRAVGSAAISCRATWTAPGGSRPSSPEGEFYRVRISFPPGLAAYFIEKGSVAVDGISLTVASLAEHDLRRPDHSAHLDGHDAAARAAGGHREPRMRHGRQVRLARPVAGNDPLMTRAIRIAKGSTTPARRRRLPRSRRPSPRSAPAR